MSPLQADPPESEIRIVEKDPTLIIERGRDGSVRLQKIPGKVTSGVQTPARRVSRPGSLQGSAYYSNPAVRIL